MWKIRRKALDGLDEEIADHIEREVEQHIARGMSPEEARRQARVAFGNVALVQEEAARALAALYSPGLTAVLRQRLAEASPETRVRVIRLAGLSADPRRR